MSRRNWPEKRKSKPMKLKSLALIATLALQAAAASAAPIGYPGSTWGGFSRDLDNTEGNGTQGWVQQGVDWTKLPGDITVNTAGAFYWRFRNKNQPFYNASGPAVIGRLVKGPVALGMEFFWQRYAELDHNAKNFSLFGSWYDKWELGKSLANRSFLIGAPFSTWGRLSYDIYDVDGVGSQGWVEQGIDWVKVKGVTVNTFAAYRWRLRTENERFYNTHGPAVGFRLKRYPFDLVLDYSWRNYPDNGAFNQRNFRNFELDFNWFFGWDLKSKKR
jgi:hypothetical protein